MPIGSELFLGMRGEAAIEMLAHNLRLTVEWDERTLNPFERCGDIDDQLAVEWKATLIGLGFTVGRPRERRYYPVKTPEGPREMVPWGLDFQYDRHEIGDTRDTAVLGVSLVSRYYPTYLDWRQVHGGSGEPIQLNRDTLDMIAEARTAIARVIPGLADATVCFKLVFY